MDGVNGMKKRVEAVADCKQALFQPVGIDPLLLEAGSSGLNVQDHVFRFVHRRFDLFRLLKAVAAAAGFFVDKIQ